MTARDIVEFLFVGIVVLAVWRTIPLSGARRLLVGGLRLAGLSCALLALKGLAYPFTEERPRHIVYLVDQSSSILATQTAWMARRLAALEAIRPPQLSSAVLVFGDDAHVVTPRDHAPLTDAEALGRALAATPIRRDQTNLEAGLLAALAAAPAQEPSRVILLSDGLQTQGSVERILPHLRRFGLEVYPVAVSSAQPPGVVWEQLTVPAWIPRGSSVPIKLVVTNGTRRPQPADLTVSLQGLPVIRQRQTVRPGWQVVSLSVPALTTGTMRVEVSMKLPGDAAPQRRTAFVEVEGPPRVRLVLEKPTQLPLLATALKRREIELSVTTPSELPVEAGQLLEDDAVLLFQIPKSSLSAEQVGALREYVERYGGGVVMVGLGGRLDAEISHEAPLDALLPVRFEPKGVQEAKRRVCILLVIDRSASMMGPRIAATKRAAVELVKQLAPEDLVGVLAFDTVPYVVVEVQPAGQVNTVLIDKLVRLKSTGGTDVLPALNAARDRLAPSEATVKHVILLSDGNTPFDSKAYRQVLAEFSRHRITLSTIGIGSAFVNTELLDWLARTTGGTFYPMQHLDELPRLIARDTQEALGRLPFTEGYFRPTRTEASEWFVDLADWPALKGYLTTTAKPGARVELAITASETPDPLLAHWPVGRGRVAVFSSDGDARWSPDWIRWPHFDSVWAQIVRQAMRPRPLEELFVWVDEQETAPSMVIEGELADPSAELMSSDGDATLPLALVQQSRFRWRAQVGHVDSGWYRLIVESRPPDSSPAFARRWIQIGRATSGSEQPNLPPDEPLLRRIAQATNGVYDVPDHAFLPPTERVERRRPIRMWLLPLALLVLLVDVALRGKTLL